MHPGVQQDQRLSPALDAAYVRPDELSLAQRLRQSLAWARQIRFVNTTDTTGQGSGHWGEVLENDLSLLLAELAALPVSQWQAKVQDFSAWTLDEQRKQCLSLAASMDRWYRLLCAHLDPHGDPHPALPSLRPLAQSIGERLGRVLGPQLRRIEGPRTSTSSMAWHPDWYRYPDGHTTASEVPSEAAADVGLREHRLFWLSLCRLLENLQKAAHQQLHASLSTQTHDPALGLLIAWTRLLHASRAPLDQFHDRLTHHYYGQRLKMPKAEGQAAMVHLVVERQPLRQPLHERALHIPAGSRFIAAVDSGSRSFAAMHPISVSPLKVQHLLTLAQDHDPAISPERDYGYASRTTAWQGQPPTLQSTVAQDVPDHPPLGGGKDSHEACQGLAIASPLLALQEGERDIHLRLHLAVPKGLVDHGRTPVSVELCQRLAAQERLEGWHLPSSSVVPWPALLSDVQQHAPSMLQQAPWLAYLLIRCVHCQDPPLLRLWLGRLFAVWLCATRENLTSEGLAMLRRHARTVLAAGAAVEGRPVDVSVDVDDPLALLFSDAPLERSLIFDRVFRGAWTAKLSTESGWLEGIDVFAMHDDSRPSVSAVSSVSASSAPADFHVLLRLRADHPAIVNVNPACHGQAWAGLWGSGQVSLPVLQLQLQSRSRLLASSLLQQLCLDSVGLHVEVRGLRSLELHNQMGRLDASKPFMPFGPLPDLSSYLLFGHPELAHKPLQQLRLHLRWSGLPTSPWSAYHEAYQAADPGTSWHPQALQVQPALLLDGQWQTGPEKSLPLFASTLQGRVLPEQSMDLSHSPLMRLHRPISGPMQQETYSLLSRHGYIRLQLTQANHGTQTTPATHAFGHALYPRLMTEKLLLNSKLKKPEALPNPPYTPAISAISVDYSAVERIPARPESSPDTGNTGSQLLHVGPFGVHPLRRVSQSEPIHVLQRWPSQGQLLIGLQGGSQSGQAPQTIQTVGGGTLSLLFKLRSQSALEPLGRPLPTLRWQAWCGESWRELESFRILMDSTQGLLRTGVIMLELPPDMSTLGPGLPPDCFWLRLLGDGDLSLLAGLQGVWTNGLVAQLEGEELATPLPAQRILAAQDPLPGLAAVHQPWPSFGGRAVETTPQWITHTAERLRHRARACSPWDYERLVLQAFPGVYKVKCIPRSEQKPGAPLTVVVVPALPAGSDADGTEAPKLDAATLAEIERFLAARMAPGQALLVRNPTYERIQVRCSLRLQTGQAVGECLRQLNTTVRHFLSPWREGGLTTHFDWRLRAEDMEALLREAAGVASVGQVSLLHITSTDDGEHRLEDTARGRRLIQPTQPWSLALPTRHHLLEISEHPSMHAPISGLSKLTLGSSFIIGHNAIGPNSI
ncbi:hypothetical protein [Leptothrix ochracea]|uniref:hypothetical protein n=1 Tax=Leptothrix ochracea TaxID=735331 RepID=UPI0034E2FBF8